MGSRVLYAIPLMIMSWGIPQQLYAEEVKPEVVAEASVPRAAPLVRHLHLLSPSKESYLNPSWPIVKIGLQPADIFFDLQKLGYEDVKEISNPPSDWEIKQYKKIIAQIDAEAANLSTNEDISKEKARLKTHLSLILTLSGSRDLAKETHKALKSAIANTKEPEILLPLVYNLGLLYLHSGYFREAADLAHQYEARYEKEKQWVGFFRSLTIESYFARGRYLRAEDYLWDLATKIGKEDLIPHLALRYADSLFWQQKYAAVVEWYKNTQVQSYLDDSNALRKLSRLYYAESLFQTGQYDEAREQFNLFKNTRAEGEAVLDMLTYRLLECDITGEPDLKKSAARLYTFALKESVGNLQSVALTEWARLLVKSGDADLNMLTSAHALLNSHSLKKLPVPLLKELLMSRAMLEYSMNDKKAALATLARIVPTKYVRDVLDPFIRELADISTALLEELAPTYWDTKDYAGFLIECDRFSQMIQMSKEKDGGTYLGRTRLHRYGHGCLRNEVI